MSFLVDQIIHGKVYVYRAENYWDKETKQEKQRRVYIGRRDEATGEILPKRAKHPTPSLSELSSTSVLTVTDSGAIWLLEQIGLTKVLKTVFPSLAEDLLGLAYYQVCESKPLYLYQDWLHTVSLNACHSLSSQAISDLCEELGSHEEHIHAFFEEWIGYQWSSATSYKENIPSSKEKTLETENQDPDPEDPDFIAEQNTKVPSSLYLDITSLSVFAKQNDFAQWGYNRDHDPLPQVNVGMVVHEATNLPLAYRLLPGSVPDVSSLKTTLPFLQELGLSPTRFVLNRGFYSQQNLLQMKQAGIAFLLPLSLSSRLASSLFAQAGEKLLSPSHAFTF